MMVSDMPCLGPDAGTTPARDAVPQNHIGPITIATHRVGADAH